MAERSMRRWLCVALAVVCLNSLWVPAAAQTDPNDVDAMARLQQAWGSGVTSWTGKDPCGGSWQGVICSGNRVISLYMVNRDLNGTIPSDIGGLSALQMLDLSFNSDLWGELPAELGSLTSLTYLSLQNCFFSGQIPPSLGNLVNLTFFRISNNMLTGTVPVFNALHQLEYVDFSNNTFDPDPFPSWLNASKSIIQTIILENIGLTGPLPVDLLSYPALHSLILPNNQIDGLLTIPENLAKNLQYVDLQNNQIINISEFNPNPTLPEMLLLDDNPVCIGGGLPEAIQTACITATASTIKNWQSPVVINNTCPNVCEHNGLALNPMRCQCSYPLSVIVLLQFLSPTFSSIDNDTLWDVDFFNQTYNSLVNLTQNVGLTFEKDQLLIEEASQASWIMPKGSVYATLSFFPLVGEIMAEPLEDTIIEAFSNHQVTYASPFNIWSLSGIIPSQAYHIRKLSNVLIAVIVSISSIVVLLLSTFLGFLIRKLIRQTALLKEIQKEFSKNAVKPFLYSYNELKVATQDFHTNNKLGAGGYGVVYKGILIDGSNIAIKRLKIKTKQALQDFLNEIIVISSIKHRNLAQLKGCCIKGDERILVYELVENQNLAEALWEGLPIQHLKLDWKIRFNIIIGVARGLTYLHEDVQPSIIHRDIKPANILLDKDYNAKIADFGLALLFPDLEDDQTHQSITKIAGTRGYLAPEYAAFGQLSAKLDVFSYGILILEIISGRKNIDLNMPVEQQYLFDWAPRLYERGCLSEMIDATMLDSSTSKADIVKVLTVAIWCTQFTAAKRPSMSQVVDSLLSTKDLPDIVIAYDGNVEHDGGSEIDIELSLMQSIQVVEKETSSLMSNTM